MASIKLTDTPVASLDVDAVIVGVVQTPTGPTLAAGTGAVDIALDGRLTEAVQALAATGEADEVSLIPTLGALRAPVIAAVGLGSPAEDDEPETRALDQPDPPTESDLDAPTSDADASAALAEEDDATAADRPPAHAEPDEEVDVPGTTAITTAAVRRASGAAARALHGRASVATTLALVGGEASAELVAAAAEGTALGGYTFTSYRSETSSRDALPTDVHVAVGAAKRPDLVAARRHAEAVVAAVVLTRDLVNTPPNALPPRALADRAQAAGRKANLDIDILDEKALARGGYGGILAVGGGSERPPRLVRMHYKDSHARAKVALIGKGITFDSGGISIKPADGMQHMTSDMAGAAAMIGVMTAVAALKLPLEVIATVPMAENLPGGSAYRPGDVLNMYGGRRVEVRNTDAEGRLVLADAIVRACEDHPDYLIEASTLTGAQGTALGARTAGVMGSRRLRARIVAAADRVDDPAWPMPLPAELRSGLDSSIADLANVAPDKAGGMLVAGTFLAEFVAAGVQWAHLDVALPAYNTGSPWGCTPVGATGVPVRTVLAALEDIAANG